MLSNTNSQVKTCKRCGKMFLFSGIGKCLCSLCKEIDEEQFSCVKEYIQDHPSATIKDVSENTKVSITRITSYIKEGRLIIPEDSAVFINCEICGAELKFGRVCHSCADTMSNEMKGAMKLKDYCIGEEPKKNHGAKMRYFTERLFEGRVY